MSTTSKDTSSKKKPTRATGSTQLRIAHFNDVYQVADHLVTRDDDTQNNVNAAKFATLLKSVTSQWEERRDGKKEGLILFSGDLFSPSLASSISKGWHMTSVLNTLGADVAVVGNHEFDFGYDHLARLAKDTVAPWLLSNIIDTKTDEVPYPLKKYHVEERLGVRIGFIGLVQQEWVTTISKWPEHFQYRPMATVGLELSAILREELDCDLIIALTHSHTSNDITLARDLFALSPSAPGYAGIPSKQGVDLILGGHDHYYWVSKGVTSWDGYDVEKEISGAASDEGDVLVVKSGSDFGDLSEVILTLKDTPEGSVRKKVIQSIEGKRHFTRDDTAEDAYMKRVVEHELPGIFEALNVPILWTEVVLNVQSEYIRYEESPIGNWIADSLRNVYDEALVKLVGKGADGVLATAGELRGDGYFQAPRVLTLLDLKRILLYDNPVVALEMGGETLWAAMESGLSKWPDTAGRFPAISGFRVSWDGSRASGSRVIGIWLKEQSTENGRPKVIEKPVLRTSDPKYVILVGGYIATGGDGYTVLNNPEKVTVVLDEEDGNAKSKFLLIQEYLQNLERSAPKKEKHKDSLEDAYQRFKTRRQAAPPKVGNNTAVTVTMSLATAIEAAPHPSPYKADDQEEADLLPKIHPVVDGRLKNEAPAKLEDAAESSDED
ncbi:Metallo-dependent phosphatase [Paxillus ammoniavirescens]|nr:Metallo-dependent phosphatase [Paxillus ammoniavirescens]